LPKKYTVEWVGDGLLDILSTVEENGGVSEKQDGVEDEMPSLKELEKAAKFSGSYGDRIQDITEGRLLRNGSILMCWTVASWGGTFQSHDDIRVAYYLLRKIE